MPCSTALLRWFLPALCLGASASLPAASETSPQPTTVQEWEEKAVREFPDLKVGQSEFNRMFLQQVTLLRELSPDTFQEPNWPYRVAQWISVWMAQKNSSADELRAQQALAAPIQGEKSRVVSEICKRVIREKLKSEEIKGREGDWIHGDHIEKSKRTEALFLANQSSPDLMPALKSFVVTVLRQNSLNFPEDRKWLEALLETPWEKKGSPETNPPLHSNLAALLGMEDSHLVFALLSEVGDVNFAEDFLYGRLPPRIEASAPSRKLRTQLIETLVKENLKLGPWTLSKGNCMEFLMLGMEKNGRALLNEVNFEVLEIFEVRDWPESLFRFSRAPSHPFSKSDKDWQEYLQILDGWWTNLAAEKWPSTGIAVPPTAASPGKMEHYLLWHCLRLREPRAMRDWLRDVRQQLLKSSTPTLRSRVETVSAIEHLISERYGPASL
jgi:hypothetical protein